jgi:hypothetical protein
MRLPSLVLWVMSFWLGSCAAEPDHPARSIPTTDFCVVEVDPALFRVLTDSVSSPTTPYYCIASRANCSRSSPEYPPRFPLLSLADTLQAIEHLLAFEHDTRRCGLPIMCYSLESSQLYLETERAYSIQVEALFLINQLYYHTPFGYAAYPVLRDDTGQVQSLDGPIVHRAYHAYRAWFKQLRQEDFTKADFAKPDPLANSGIRWY